MPTLLIMAESAIAGNHAHSGVIQFGITGVERKLVSHAGHLAYLECPEEFERMRLEFSSSIGRTIRSPDP